MVKKYIVWSASNHSRGTASLKDYLAGNYGWLVCSEPLYGSEKENKYVSLLECKEDRATDLSNIIATLTAWTAKEISPKLAVMYARKYNPAYIDLMTQVQYGYPYLSNDNVTIVRDTTHVDYSQAMQDDDTSETSKLELVKTDLGMIRVLEDLVSTLITKNIIALNDLPASAQTKINNRANER